ncbi:MAG: GNAT family N-acetyltransferase [Clostridiales bacterium]|nr:GNAT family N-acetyltransferase [Clostridiales bacterium]
MYRWAGINDKQAIMDLWAVDFESSEPYYSWYFDNVFQPGLTLCDFYGTNLAAMLQIAPYQLSLGGMAHKIAYLVGVICAPSFRGQGLATALIKEAHSKLLRQGYAATLLYSDIPAFYKPSGYCHCYTRQQLHLAAEQFSLLSILLDGQSDWREGSLVDDIPALSAIYERMTSHYEGYIIRSADNWRTYLGEHICDKARLALAENRAYILYRLEKKVLQVIELGFVDVMALRCALAEAARLGMAEGAQSLAWPAPANAPQLLPHIPSGLWQEQPFVMAKLLGCQSAIEDLKRSLSLPLWINEYT